MTGVSPAQKLRDMFNPHIVGWFDLVWALLMLAVAVWGVWSWGEPLMAVGLALLVLAILASDVNEYHLYRVGYALGVLHERNGISTDPGHPRDLRKLRAEL